MGRKTIDRTGEKGVNNFGSEMVIVEYRKWDDVDIYFPEYDWLLKHVRYAHFKNGEIKCPYERRYFNVGYLGEGKYKMSENGKFKKEYKIWYYMLQRCYDPKYQEREPTYKGCTVEEFWLNFQNATEWYKSNYYEIPGERIELDKDILFKGNKIYSRDTCIFVPQKINLLFTKRGNNIRLRKSGNYQVNCNNIYGKTICLGTYSSKEEAFQVYKQYKEKLIKDVIDSYKGKIPEPFYSRLRDAMYNYEVEIDD